MKTNTYKILKDNIQTIYLGSEDGSLLEIDRKYFDFLPEVGEYVEVFTSGNQYFIQKKDTASPNYDVVNNNSYSDTNNILVLKTCGWICIVLSLLFLPVVFGIIGIILSILLIKRGEEDLGATMFVAAVVAMIVGIWFGAVIGTMVWG